jgi:hypothetical protein
MPASPLLDAGFDYAAEFEWGLDLILDGIAMRSEFRASG